ncbi:hypothetical protein HUT16_37165 [Kitasatospora sp. NA04385]|uniref:hypothetical protein n=1 Tax=Kitasatospora sp. NA04385 TaxID=2742135 RepID=UPI00159083BC|nr:hypothetical protein [Kitasatospora sp. NA04385]QKW23967.1 hypothetical protein HUT16_37165 [Kitasatospora sp. NA04385]
MVDDYLDRQVDAACSRAIRMLDDRTGPFATGWPTWTPEAAWPLPLLPDGADQEAEPPAPYRL